MFLNVLSLFTYLLFLYWFLYSQSSMGVLWKQFTNVNIETNIKTTNMWTMIKHLKTLFKTIIHVKLSRNKRFSADWAIMITIVLAGLVINSHQKGSHYSNIFEYSSRFYTLTHSPTNVRIYSYKQIWHERMSEYIHKRKIDTI
jgi:hypothetical protein